MRPALANLSGSTPARALSGALIGALALVALGCGGSQRARSLSYGDSARELYELALSDYRDENCQEAEPIFRRVRREYSYSRYAGLAELRLADCMMQQDKYVEAIGAYRAFVRYRPSHPQVSYARFRTAEAYFEQMPSDFILSPPAAERDQSPTRDALRQLRRFILDFPEDPRVPRASRMAAQALSLLARHELYVANFYLDRDKPRAAVGRLETLLRAYRGSEVEPEALLLLGRTYLQMRNQEEARTAFTELIRRFPRSGYAAQARGYLEEAVDPAPATGG
jgi:outer membrane protein assembly factor BamD